MSDETFRITSAMPTPGVLTLEIVGELDADTSELLTDELARWLGVAELIIDLHACTFVDSRGLRALIECRRQVGFDATMRLLGVPSRIDHTLRLAGLEATLGLDAVA